MCEEGACGGGGRGVSRVVWGDVCEESRVGRGRCV